MEGLLWALGIEKALTWVVGLESTSANPALVTDEELKNTALQKRQEVPFVELLLFRELVYPLQMKLART